MSDIVGGVRIVCIPLLANTTGLAFWQLLTLVFIGGLFKSPAGTARGALLPDLADMAKMRREQANAMIGGVCRISNFIGAPLAALLIIFIGTRNLLWLDGASFLLSALLIDLLVPAPRANTARAENKSGYIRHPGEGMHFILRDQVPLAIIGTVLVANLLDQALTAVVAPAYIKQMSHSPQPLEWMYGAFGGAAFVGTLIFAAIGHHLPRRLAFASALPLEVRSASGYCSHRFSRCSSSFIPSLDWGAAPANPLIDTILQERVSSEMRARVFGTTVAGAYIGMPLVCSQERRWLAASESHVHRVRDASGKMAGSPWLTPALTRFHSPGPTASPLAQSRVAFSSPGLAYRAHCSR